MCARGRASRGRGGAWLRCLMTRDTAAVSKAATAASPAGDLSASLAGAPPPGRQLGPPRVRCRGICRRRREAAAIDPGRSGRPPASSSAAAAAAAAAAPESCRIPAGAEATSELRAASRLSASAGRERGGGAASSQTGCGRSSHDLTGPAGRGAAEWSAERSWAGGDTER